MALDALLATARGWLTHDPDPETAAELSALLAKVEGKRGPGRPRAVEAAE